MYLQILQRETVLAMIVEQNYYFIDSSLYYLTVVKCFTEDKSDVQDVGGGIMHVDSWLLIRHCSF